MKLLICLSVLVILAIVFAYRRFRGSNTETAIDIGADDYLILYYAPWCGACKAFKPVWDLLKKKSTLVKFKEINCDANSQICERDSIAGYPTVRLITKSQKIIEYDGNRSVPDLVNFIKENVQ